MNLLKLFLFLLIFLNGIIFSFSAGGVNFIYDHSILTTAEGLNYKIDSLHCNSDYSNCGTTLREENVGVSGARITLSNYDTVGSGGYYITVKKLRDNSLYVDRLSWSSAGNIFVQSQLGVDVLLDYSYWNSPSDKVIDLS